MGLETLIAAGVVIVVLVLVYKYVMRLIAKNLSKKKIDPEASNGLRMLIRIITLVIAIVVLLWGLGVETTSLSVFAGVAGITLAFASQRVLGNMVSGIYIMVARPFRAGDYIKVGPVGEIEGIVRHITLNYVLLETMFQNNISIANQQILTKEILNYRYEERRKVLYRYSFELHFDYSLSLEQNKKIFSDIAELHKGQFAKPAETYSLGITHNAMKFAFVIYVKDPEDLFTLKSQLIAEILQAREKAQKQKN